MEADRIPHRPLDELEDALLSHSARMNVFEYEFLLLVREFEIRQGWRTWHLNNCAEWLNMKCGISLGAAREKVRVAMALFDLPLCSKAFEEGRLSYSKARAITRAADRATEQEYLDYSLAQPASRVEEYCRKRRNAKRRASLADANAAHRGRYLSCFPNADGGLVINVELPPEQGALFQKALDMAVATLEKAAKGVKAGHCCDESGESGESDEEPEDTFFQKQADAFMEITRGYLAGGKDTHTSTADHYQVMVHVDERALREEEGASDLPIETVRRITCDASLVPIVDDENGNPLNVGRKHRIVPTKLRRALLARDEHCRFPGCSHTKWLAAHHVMHWVDGGETSVENTMLLCPRHHHLLHEGGYTIEQDYQGNWYFRSSRGKVIPDLSTQSSNPSRDASLEINERPALYVVNQAVRRVSRSENGSPDQVFR